MEPKYIRIRGARMHNLKNINADLPRNKLIVFTGVSGSGKSSLAFDTLYAEGQRRYVESLSTYARQFLGQMEKPDVDLLEGLSPAVSIEQKTTSKNPRSTVGTVTEIYDFLRLLFAKTGQPHCPQCGLPIKAQSIEEMVATLLARPEGEKILILAPLLNHSKGSFEQLLQKLRNEGYVRVRVDGAICSLHEPIMFDTDQVHTIQVVVDRLVVKPSSRRRLEESVATVLRLSSGVMVAHFPDSGEETFFSETATCYRCAISTPELSPQLFSFNNPQGACAGCAGLGVKHFLDPSLIVADPHLSLEQGAIEPWKRGKLAFLAPARLCELAALLGFKLTTPYAELPQKIKDIILYGSEAEQMPHLQTKKSGKGDKLFEGVIPRLERLFAETSSAAIREEVANFMDEQPCPECSGARLKPEALAVRLSTWSIVDLTRLPISRLIEELQAIRFDHKQTIIAGSILKELFDRLSFLHNVGLGYLCLDRKASTLSGGEGQRIRLASQIGAKLAGVMYILDEPSIGLHQRDNDKLIKTLHDLRDLGNTVIVVEHDPDMIRAADHILDMGPGAGIHGGEILYSGTVCGLLASTDSITGKYLSGKTKIAIPQKRRPIFLDDTKTLTLHHAAINNLKNITVTFPLGAMTCVTGVSGSGKSSLVIQSLFKESCRILSGFKNTPTKTRITGLEHIDKIIDIDQSPIGRTPRSNPATYTGVLAPIRELFARLPEARARGYKANRFSFNLKGGRCESCEGDGVIQIAMHFLPDVYVTCDSCNGRRYNRETLEICYRGLNIAEILAMTVADALVFFKNIPPIKTRLQTLSDVGLAYMSLGQSAVTLSGGEAQRVKLARELSKRSTGKTLYILDEPTTGLHQADISLLLKVLSLLVDNGNTVIIIEHNLDVIKCADYVIDLGPEGGDGGGRIVVAGRPEEIVGCRESYTGLFLKKVL